MQWKFELYVSLPYSHIHMHVYTVRVKGVYIAFSTVLLFSTF